MRFRQIVLIGIVAAVGASSIACSRKRRVEVEVEKEEESAMVDGVSDDTIKIAQAATFTGVLAGVSTEMYRGAMAYFLEVNAKGGVHGRSIKVVNADDKYTVEGGTSATEKLIADENPFLFFNGTGTDPARGMLTVLQKNEAKQYLLWGSSSPASVTREGPLAQFAFNLRPSMKNAARDAVAALASAGAKKLGVFEQDNAYGRECTEATRLAAASLNVEVVSVEVAPASLRIADRTKNVMDLAKKMRAAGVDAVVMGATYNPASVAALDMREIGWDAPIAHLGTADTTARQLAAEEKKSGKSITHRMFATAFAPPISAEQLRAVREYRELMDRRNPQVPQDIADPNYKPLRYASSSLEGYINARVMVEAFERAGKRLTRAAFRAAVESINGLDIGIGQAVTFGKGDNQGIDNVWLAVMNNGELMLPPDLKASLLAKPVNPGKPASSAAASAAAASPKGAQVAKAAASAK